MADTVQRIPRQEACFIRLLRMHHCGALGRSLRQNEEEEAVYLAEGYNLPYC